MFKKLLAAFAVMLGIGIGAVAIQTPAAAFSDSCQSGVVCWYEGWDGSGPRHIISFSGSGGLNVCNVYDTGSGGLAFKNQSIYSRMGSGIKIRLYSGGFSQGCASQYQFASFWPGELTSWAPGDFGYKQLWSYKLTSS